MERGRHGGSLFARARTDVYPTPIELETLSSRGRIYVDIRGHSRRSDKETMSNAIYRLPGDINGHIVLRRFLYSSLVN